jgi:hypothetical protein
MTTILRTKETGNSDDYGLGGGGDGYGEAVANPTFSVTVTTTSPTDPTDPDDSGDPGDPAFYGVEVRSGFGTFAGASLGGGVGGLIGSVLCAAESKSGKRGSAKGKHEAGQARV